MGEFLGRATSLPTAPHIYRRQHLSTLVTSQAGLSGPLPKSKVEKPSLAQQFPNF